MKSLGCMLAVKTPEAPRTLAFAHPAILPSPFRDRVGCFHHVQFRGYPSVHLRFNLQPPCLRFAMTVTSHHARLGKQLLVKLYRCCHLRTGEFHALARRNSHTTLHTGLYQAVYVVVTFSSY